MNRSVLRLIPMLGALALCSALTPTTTTAQTQEAPAAPESEAQLPQATAPAPAGAGEPRATKIMPLGASNTYGMYENLTSRGGYRGPLHDLLTAEGVAFDFVGLDSDGDIPDADHNGYPGRSIEWFTRPVNKTAEEDRDVRWAIYSGNTPAVIHFIEQAQMTAEDVILVLLGTNNVRLGQGAETMIREIDVLLDQIVTSEASPAVLLMKLTPVSNDDWPDDDETRTNNDTISLFNEGLEMLVADKYGAQGVTLVDAGTTGEDRSLDGVHLNEAGYRKVAEAFFEGLMATGLRVHGPTEGPAATATSSP